mgnify:CR=1 FL=1
MLKHFSKFPMKVERGKTGFSSVHKKRKPQPGKPDRGLKKVVLYCELHSSQVAQCLGKFFNFFTVVGG